MRDLLIDDTVITFEALAGSLLAVLVLHWIVFRILRRVGTGAGHVLARAFARRCYWPTRLLAAAAVASLVLGQSLTGDAAQWSKHGLGLVVIAAIAWSVVRLTQVAEDLLVDRFDIDARDNREARKVRTQAEVLQRVVAVVVTIIAVAAMLTTFPQVRVMGTSILASAGIAGLVVGLAAQSTLSNLLAGIQIALTDPIRIDDVVVVEGEWGRVEEITFTYVVIRVWDERRLVLPISYFTTTPFQNWTRTQAQILGTVYLRVDYTVPVDEVRQQLTKLVEDSPLWDRRVVGLQVTDTTERTVELRALVSAADSSAAWDLRCKVREGLIEFLQRRYPETLPRTRAELSRNDGALMPVLEH